MKNRNPRPKMDGLYPNSFEWMMRIREWVHGFPAEHRMLMAQAYYEEWDESCYRYCREVEELVDSCQRSWKRWAGR